MSRRAGPQLAAIAFGITAAVAFTAARADDPSPWQEIAWGLPRDAWPAGRSYRCPAERCGAEIVVLMRPKIGFCNCTTGVADDDEVDRVTDVDLVAGAFRPLGPGQAVSLGGLAGRSRRYQSVDAAMAGRSFEAIALARRCDLIVALVDGGPNTLQRPPAVEALVGDSVRGWIADVLEGRSPPRID